MLESTARHRENPLLLAARTAGSPRAARAKVARLLRMLRGYGNGSLVDAKLEKLRRLGAIERIPTRVQLAIGAFDMLRFFISPAAADYYASQGINFTFHQLLRFLDEPASLADPVGFFSTEDAIIGHLRQVVHANPVYDLQLLSSCDGGLDALEDQLQTMMAGTHPRSESILAIVEEADYHANLLEFVRAWRADPSIPPMLRSNLGASEELSTVERTFGTLTGAMRYFCKLPEAPAAALLHAITVREFPRHLGA